MVMKRRKKITKKKKINSFSMRTPLPGFDMLAFTEHYLLVMFVLRIMITQLTNYEHPLGL